MRSAASGREADFRSNCLADYDSVCIRIHNWAGKAEIDFEGLILQLYFVVDVLVLCVCVCVYWQSNLLVSGIGWYCVFLKIIIFANSRSTVTNILFKCIFAILDGLKFE